MVSASQWMVNTIRMIDEVEICMQAPMQLAIVGRGSSSKSTLVNAILGKPEVVRTGHGAETFNVSWLKYGDDDAPIVVHFKNGTKQDVDRKRWNDWASHKGEENLKNEVKYIEVTSGYDMLKRINIIDTPGLDATSRVDSENTKEFLRMVHPDAVVLLFTESLSEKSLKLIQEFQDSSTGISFSINPMNALGVLSKMDVNWKVWEDNDALQVSFSAIRHTLSNRTDVNKALFRILPVSALMGLASCYITEDDVADFRALAAISDVGKFTKLFDGVDFFVRQYDFVTVPKERRENLILKYSLYGIYVCVRALQKSPEISISELSLLLREKGGFDTFVNLLISHFGDRASLIKVQQGFIRLLRACDEDRQYAATLDRKNLLESVYTRIMNLENELHELREWSLLLDIYEGRVMVSEDFMQEFLVICGENGHSAVDKLHVDSSMDVGEMIAIAEDRCRYWRSKYSSLKGLSAKRALPLGVISKSYELLAVRLQEQKQMYERAIRDIALYNHYVYGKS